MRVLWLLESLPGARKTDTRRALDRMDLAGSTALSRLGADRRAELLVEFGSDTGGGVVSSGSGATGPVARRLVGDSHLRAGRSGQGDARVPPARASTRVCGSAVRGLRGTVARRKSPDAYHFVDQTTCSRTASPTGGFLEWTEFLDYLQGSPMPEPPEGRDVLLRDRRAGRGGTSRRCIPEALLLFVDAPDRSAAGSAAARTG
ncbi:MAG: hypothetical protein V9E94_06370 [Microthrixaceae bacterium]